MSTNALAMRQKAGEEQCWAEGNHAYQRQWTVLERGMTRSIRNPPKAGSMITCNSCFSFHMHGVRWRLPFEPKKSSFLHRFGSLKKFLCQLPGVTEFTENGQQLESTKDYPLQITAKRVKEIHNKLLCFLYSLSLR